jgi:hypothetical protein
MKKICTFLGPDVGLQTKFMHPRDGALLASSKTSPIEGAFVQKRVQWAGNAGEANGAKAGAVVPVMGTGGLLSGDGWEASGQPFGWPSDSDRPPGAHAGVVIAF